MTEKEITIKDIRKNLAEVINDVSIANKTYIITKFGKPKAMVVPISKYTEREKQKRLKAFKRFAGAWSEREDIGDSVEYAKYLRKKSRKHEKFDF